MTTTNFLFPQALHPSSEDPHPTQDFYHPHQTRTSPNHPGMHYTMRTKVAIVKLTLFVSLSHFRFP